MIASFRLCALALALAAAPVAGSPPPPPPSYVSDVAKLLTQTAGTDTPAQLAGFLADDVKTYVNDRLVAQGKAAWLRHYSGARPTIGKLLSYSEGLDAKGASLMVVDQFDPLDRSKIPPTMVVDPRFETRATLYEFGTDQRIHAIRTLVGAGFWIKP